jgi:hypothetical protein
MLITGTVRRFLERHHNSLDLVVFAVENIDIGIYEVLLPLYFPRSTQEEETALWQLPTSVGGSDGEPLLPDRQIRIIDNPQHSLDGELLILCNISISRETQAAGNEFFFEVC